MRPALLLLLALLAACAQGTQAPPFSDGPALPRGTALPPPGVTIR